MKVTLWQAAGEFRSLREQIDPETGEMPDGLGDLQDAAKEVVVRKLRGSAAYILEEQEAVEVLKRRVKLMQDKIKAIESGIEWTREYIARNMKLTGIHDVEAEERDYRVRLYPGRDKSVNVADQTKVPKDYLREIPPVEASWEVDKKKALADLKQGVVIDGLQLVEKDRLEVK